MKTVVSLAITVAVIALLSAACEKKKEEGAEAPVPTPPPEETATAAVPEAVRPVVQPACVASRPPEGNPTNEPVPPGTYCVCDPGPAGAGVHDSIKGADSAKGAHLNFGDTVVIGKPDDAVKVALNGQDVNFIKSPDGNELGAMINYPHEAVSMGGETEVVTHLVQITPGTGYVAPLGAGVNKCHKEDASKKIIRIAFCYWGQKPLVAGEAPEVDAPDKWVCPKDVPNTHLGDAHAEN